MTMSANGLLASGWLRCGEWVHVMLPPMEESEARVLEGALACLTYVPEEKAEGA